MLISKHFKKQKSCENCLPERKMTAKFYWKWDSWVILKTLRMKDRMLWNGLKKEVIKWGSGHVWRGKLNRLPLPSDVRHRMWDIRRRWDVGGQDSGCEASGEGGTSTGQDSGCETSGEGGTSAGQDSGCEASGEGGTSAGQDSGCEASGEGGTSADRIPDVKHPENVGLWPDRIPDVIHPKNAGLQPDKISRCETSGEGGMRLHENRDRGHAEWRHVHGSSLKIFQNRENE